MLLQLKSFISSIRECGEPRCGYLSALTLSADKLFEEFNVMATGQAHSDRKFWSSICGINTNVWHVWMAVHRVELYVPWPASQMDKAQRGCVNTTELTNHLKAAGRFLFTATESWATSQVSTEHSVGFTKACFQASAGTRHLFVKMLSSQRDMPKLLYPPAPRKSFMLLRLLHESPSLISVHFAFYNTSPQEQLEEVPALPVGHLTGSKLWE